MLRRLLDSILSADGNSNQTSFAADDDDDDEDGDREAAAAAAGSETKKLDFEDGGGGFEDVYGEAPAAASSFGTILDATTTESYASKDRFPDDSKPTSKAPRSSSSSFQNRRKLTRAQKVDEESHGRPAWSENSTPKSTDFSTVDRGPSYLLQVRRYIIANIAVTMLTIALIESMI